MGTILTDGRTATGLYPARTYQVVLIVLIVAVGIWSILTLGVADRNLVDTDGYMRATRVLDLATGEAAWTDGAARESNAPFGHTMHWTRPMDVVILAVGAPVTLASGVATGVYWGSVLAGPLLLLAIALVIAWGIRPIVGTRGAWVGSLIAIVQPAIINYALAGRADHHALMALSIAVMMACAIRSTLARGTSWRVPAVIGGLASALALWVAVEALVWIGLLFVLGAILTFVYWPKPLDRLVWWWTAFAGAVLVASVLEHGVGILVAEYDRMSGPHLLLAAAAVVFWWTAVVVRRVGAGRTAFVIASATVMALAVGAMALAYPAFFRGPLVDVPAEAVERWLVDVVELRSVAHDGWASFVRYATVPLIGLVGSGYAWRHAEGRHRVVWGCLAVATGVAIAVSFAGTRFTGFAAISGAAGVSALLLAGASRLPRGGAAVRIAGVAIVLVIALGGPVVGAIAASGSDGDGATALACTASDVADAVGSVDRPGAVVLAAIDHGPEILWRTDAAVVASPYHRNHEGILDQLDAFEGTPEAALEEVIVPRGVDLVAVCAVSGDVAAGDQSFGSLIATGRPPSFLDLEATSAGALVYRVAP